MFVQTITLKTVGDKKPSRLEQLPAELRNVIYSYAVVETAPISIDEMFQLGTKNAGIQPPLARTNRKIRGEVLPLYYAEKTFVTGISNTIYPVAGTSDLWLALTLPYLKHLGSFGGSLVYDGLCVDLLVAVKTNRTKRRYPGSTVVGMWLCTCLLDASLDALNTEGYLTARRIKSLMTAANLDLLRTTRSLGRLDCTDITPHVAWSLHGHRA